MKKNITSIAPALLVSPNFWQTNQSWIWNQAAAVLAKTPPVRSHNRYSSVATLERIQQDPLARQIFNVFTSSPRSQYIKNQSLVQHYNQSVPLVLSVYKRYYNVCYHSWDDDVKVLLEFDHQLVLSKRYHTLPCSSTLDWSTFPTRNLSGYCSLGSWSADVIGRLDRLSKHIYLQTWLWHHTKISPYSIQSLASWDQRTTTLHTSDIF
jgi:hypothetical protein